MAESLHGVLGRCVDYPRDYDPSLLFAIPRAHGRRDIGIAATSLPFIGSDRWHAYELGWLDARGKPCVATARLELPATTPQLIESKSLKRYFNAFNGTRFSAAEEVRERMVRDLSSCAAGEVQLQFGLPETGDDDSACIDAVAVDIDHYGPPDAGLLRAEAAGDVSETLRSGLLKSNCPVTGQPDWASVRIAYRGPRIDRAALLAYLVSFRDHREFHEQCVERIFVDVLARCRPETLCVEARYTRRGGLDINPWRATAGHAAPRWMRDARQ